MIDDDDDESMPCVMMPAGSNAQGLRCDGCDDIVGTNEVWFKGVGEYDGTAQCMRCLFKAATDHLIAEHGGKN
jgi:hypothetical protein